MKFSTFLSALCLQYMLSNVLMLRRDWWVSLVNTIFLAWSFSREFWGAESDVGFCQLPHVFEIWEHNLIFLPIQVRQLCLLSRTYIWNVFNEIQLFPSQDCSKTTFLIEPFRVNIECSVQTLFKWNMNSINWKYKWNIFEKVQFRALWSILVITD